MKAPFTIFNGTLIPNEEAKISINNISFSYGFGVYENIRLRNGAVYFLDEHIDRLFHSATCIGLPHHLTKEQFSEAVTQLIHANNVETANIKILLIGGANAEEALWYIMLLAPKFLETKQYREGVHAITKTYERFLPQAKTLNMLPSYLFYRQAQTENAYDTILVDRDGNMLEGTRSNIFAIKDGKLCTPPKDYVLDGVTRRTVIACAKDHGLIVEEEMISYTNLDSYDGFFFTNTSGKIVPIRSIDKTTFDEMCQLIQELMGWYDEYVESRKIAISLKP